MSERYYITNEQIDYLNRFIEELAETNIIASDELSEFVDNIIKEQRMDEI